MLINGLWHSIVVCSLFIYFLLTYIIQVFVLIYAVLNLVPSHLCAPVTLMMSEHEESGTEGVSSCHTEKWRKLNSLQTLCLNQCRICARLVSKSIGCTASAVMASDFRLQVSSEWRTNLHNTDQGQTTVTRDKNHISCFPYERGSETRSPSADDFTVLFSALWSAWRWAVIFHNLEISPPWFA